VNDQTQCISAWLQKNKLSLNYSKTTYLLFNTYPHQAVCSKFRIMLNQKEIKRSESVIYLGLRIVEKLTWSDHINTLSYYYYAVSFIFCVSVS